MQIPPETTFRNLGHSNSSGRVVRQRAARLERFFDDIVARRVVVEGPHQHRHEGIDLDWLDAGDPSRLPKMDSEEGPRARQVAPMSRFLSVRP